MNKDKTTPLETYPQVGGLYWLKTNEETKYEGVAYIESDNPEFWVVINPKDLHQHERIYIAVDDEYRLLEDELGKPTHIIAKLEKKAVDLYHEAHELNQDDNPNDRDIINGLIREANGYAKAAKFLSMEAQP